jgi:hypothetical protein
VRPFAGVISAAPPPRISNPFSPRYPLNGGQRSLYGKGPANKKTGDPRGGWVGQSTKKDWGQIYFFDNFYRVFELPSSRNAQKRDKRKFEKKSVLDFLSNFLLKTFRHDFLCKTFFVVFLNSRPLDIS